MQTLSQLRIFTAHYDSPLGDITMASDGEALTGLWFDGQKYFVAFENRHKSQQKQLPVFDTTCRWLDCYFGGGNPSFSPLFSLHGTPFQMSVWQLLCSIPYGKTVTYGEVACRLGIRSAQAVGGAVSRNPVSIIVPCHRVVGADGLLTGYAGGLDRKRFLLQLEKDSSGIC